MRNGWGSTMYGAREGVGGGNEKNDGEKIRSATLWNELLLWPGTNNKWLCIGMSLCVCETCTTRPAPEQRAKIRFDGSESEGMAPTIQNLYGFFFYPHWTWRIYVRTAPSNILFLVLSVHRLENLCLANARRGEWARCPICLCIWPGCIQVQL